jgi:hypothetical protein
VTRRGEAAVVRQSGGQSAAGNMFRRYNVNLRDSLHKHFVYDIFYRRYFFLIKLPKGFDDSLFIYRADLIKHNPAGFFV